MLQHIDAREAGACIAIKDAKFPQPFAYALEFNPPVHETWNIVHYGMQVPQAHQVYICADNCMRGVVMTAAEMGALDRFSCVVLTEKDFYDGRLEEITLEGITDVLHKLTYKPRAVLVFPVCTHHFLGSDMRYVYRELEKRFPDIDFMRCFMDPIMQKEGLAPEQKERKGILDALPVRALREDLYFDFGGNAPSRTDNDLYRMIASAGKRCAQLQSCTDYAAFQTLGQAKAILVRLYVGLYAARALAQRTGARVLYLPPEVLPDKIDAQMGVLAEELGIDPSPFTAQRQQAEQAIAHAKARLGRTRIELDNVALPRPLGFARLLLAHGFNVQRIWLDKFDADEQEDFIWLQEHYPELEIGLPIHPGMRTLHGQISGTGRVLAIGPKAAWSAMTNHFVNVIEYGGLWGYNGLIEMMRLMVEADEEEKDLRALVPRKGLGCRCVL